jgi:hypothetical protein
MDKQNILLISCYFGKDIKKLYDSPLDDNCYFFSNNINIKEEAENKNWKFVFVNFELSEDSVVSSCQSKYIKFLKFLDDFTEFKQFNYILYFDHKVYIKEEHIDKLINISDNNYSVIIRKHEHNRNTIMSEVDAAMGQERYSRNMNKTLELIEHKIKKNEIKNEIDICNTGLILYIDYNSVKPMLDDIYYTCVDQQQPECQIIWAIYSQKYLKKIKLIDFYNVVNPQWIELYSIYVKDISNKHIYIYLFSLIIIIIFLSYRKKPIRSLFTYV